MPQARRALLWSTHTRACSPPRPVNSPPFHPIHPSFPILARACPANSPTLPGSSQLVSTCSSVFRILLSLARFLSVSRHLLKRSSEVCRVWRSTQMWFNTWVQTACSARLTPASRLTRRRRPSGGCAPTCTWWICRWSLRRAAVQLLHRVPAAHSVSYSCACRGRQYSSRAGDAGAIARSGGRARPRNTAAGLAP